MKELFRTNNFDVIRLIAATEVALTHSAKHLKVESNSALFFDLLGLFPGVPIFFFVSGFLISKSFESNPVISEYAQNRVLRIYPALIACTFLAISSVFLSGYLSDVNFNFGEMAAWVVGQVTFVQFYNPEFMRGFGSGVLNGSLWTIAVELQFYVITPILYWLFGFVGSSNQRANKIIVLLVMLFMAFHAARYYFIEAYTDNIFFKLAGVTFLPWIYMFLVGMLFQRNFKVLYPLLSGKVFYILPVYLGVSYFTVYHLGWGMGNGINPILYFVLSFLIFSFAYSFPSFSKRVLNGNDISYGVYIYHIPVVNLLLYYGYSSNTYYVYVAVAITIIVSAGSWILIEKPGMKLKKHPLNPMSSRN